jgi:hypothetical protein
MAVRGGSTTKKLACVAMAAALGASLVVSGCAAPRRRPAPSVARYVPPPPPPPVYPSYVPWDQQTVESRLVEFGARSRWRWRPYVEKAHVEWPPPSVEFVVFKRERRLDVYAGSSPFTLALVRSFEITAASGGPGPKLREGDRQVPEGIYTLDKLNPKSAFHVSLHVAYPNEFDELMAERDRRRDLGGQIMIHGGDQSIGCVAVGDEAAEDLFTIAAESGIENVTVMIVPRDFRRTGESDPLPGQPPWVRTLYEDLDRRLAGLPVAGPPYPTTIRRGSRELSAR